jgi:protein SCO1/2
MKRLVFALFCMLSLGCAREPDLMTYYPVPDFSLTDQSGKTVTRADLAGKVWVADFIFTNCGGTCPMMTGRMRKLQDALPQEVRLVSFTVDPSRDTPQVLSNYAKQHGAGDRWLFLTGEKSALYDLSIQGFKLALDDANGTEAEPITHSTRIVLVDRQGQIRGYYSGLEEEALQRLSEDVKKLL